MAYRSRHRRIGGTYVIDADGCVSEDPCPWRGWRTEKKATKTTVDPTSDNVYKTRRNADGTTDMIGFNPRTGSVWDQQYDPSQNLQSGHTKTGKSWQAPLTTLTPSGDSVSPTSNYTFGGRRQLELTPTPQRGAFEPPPSNYTFGGLRQLEVTPTPDLDYRQVGTEGASASFSDEEAAPTAALRQRLLDEQKECERNAALGAVLSGMQPGSLLAASKAAARQRCLKEQDLYARTSCLTAAGFK